MKKLVAGCLVVLIVGVVGLAAASYFVYRAARPMLDNASEYLAGLKALGTLPALDAGLERRGAYEPPSNGELSPSQVERFARVQTAVRQGLGARFEDLRARHRHLETGDPSTLSGRDLLAALADLSGIVVDARRIQVDALNAQAFSQAEYAWVRREIFRAAGVELASGLDLQALERLARDSMAEAGVTPPDVRLPKVSLPEVPPRNRALVKPYAGRLTEWLPLAYWGL